MITTSNRRGIRSSTTMRSTKPTIIGIIKREEEISLITNSNNRIINTLISSTLVAIKSSELTRKEPIRSQGTMWKSTNTIRNTKLKLRNLFRKSSKFLLKNRKKPKQNLLKFRGLNTLRKRSITTKKPSNLMVKRTRNGSANKLLKNKRKRSNLILLLLKRLVKL